MKLLKDYNKKNLNHIQLYYQVVPVTFPVNPWSIVGLDTGYYTVQYTVLQIHIMTFMKLHNYYVPKRVHR